MTPKFSRRHYEAIAETIRNHDIKAKPNTEEESIKIATLTGIIDDLGAMFKEDTPKFNSVRFRARCGWHNMILKG